MGEVRIEVSPLRHFLDWRCGVLLAIVLAVFAMAIGHERGATNVSQPLTPAVIQSPPVFVEVLPAPLHVVLPGDTRPRSYRAEKQPDGAWHYHEIEPAPLVAPPIEAPPDAPESRCDVGLEFVSLRAPAKETIRGKVVGVHDGDTLTVLKADKRQINVRLLGIDCPEVGRGKDDPPQPFGTAARLETSRLAFGQDVTVEVDSIDLYGRTLARVLIDGHDLGAELLEAGLAWHYVRYSKDATPSTPPTTRWPRESSAPVNFGARRPGC